ncbi:MAG: preprotein translocase subunit SecE [Candidatus Nealsonbacteria bacterium]
MKILNYSKKLIPFLKEVRMEIKKINWPTRKETIKYTLIVIGVSAVVAIFLGSVDYILSLLLNKFVL